MNLLSENRAAKDSGLEVLRLKEITRSYNQVLHAWVRLRASLLQVDLCSHSALTLKLNVTCSTDSLRPIHSIMLGNKRQHFCRSDNPNLISLMFSCFLWIGSKPISTLFHGNRRNEQQSFVFSTFYNDLYTFLYNHFCFRLIWMGSIITEVY